jgi:EmrB/QacA subfamily drug resistance transporter
LAYNDTLSVRFEWGKDQRMALIESRVAAPPAAEPAPLDPRRWWTLAVLCTSLIIVIVGNTSLNIALPTLARSLGASTAQQQWMVDAYSLVFCGLLLTAGATGDRYGRKGALQAGLLLFLAAAITASFATTAEQVIACRALMGLAAAFVMPSTLSILTNVFPPHERAKAIAVWAGISGAGAAIGPIASGFLLAHFWWGSIFLVNVPIVLIALIGGWFFVPKSKDPMQARLDPIGALLSIAGVVTLVYTIIEGPGHGWGSATTLGGFALAVFILGLFGWWELHRTEPMVDLRYFKNRQLSVASGSMTLVYFAMFGIFFLMTQYFQLIHGYGTLSTGLRQGPVAIVMILVAPRSPALATRFGRNRVVAAGMGSVAIGMLLFSLAGPHTSYYFILGTMVFISAGMALTISPLTASIMSGVPLRKAGIGSAINDTTRELGGALGVAVIGSLVASRYVSSLSHTLVGLPADLIAKAKSSLAGAISVSSSTPGRSELADTARQAFLDGMHLALRFAAIIAIIAAAIAYRLLPAGTDHRVQVH